MSLRILFALAAMCLLATPLAASDGRFEINQICASFTSGCFPGDTQGFPITITQPGSYVLTSNLVTPSVNTTLIVVDVSDVSIDLNGFTLSGPVNCSGSPLSCSSATGTGNGIRVANDIRNVSVRNGQIRGMGRCGIATPSGVISGMAGIRIEDLEIRENRDCGIGVGLTPGIIRNVNVVGNGNSGIGAGSFMYVLDSVIRSNGGSQQNNAVQAGFCSNSVIFGNGANAAAVRSCVSIANNRCGWTGGNSHC